MTRLPLWRYRLVGLLVAAVAVVVSARPASADVILGAVAGTINAGGPGAGGSIPGTFDQSGLSSNYVSGVTDFDAYLATGPVHSIDFLLEWFSNEGTTSASVTYDLGAVYNIGRVALWNEDASGIGLLSLFGSTDNVSFAPLLLDISPTNNPIEVDYGPDVLQFAATDLRYVMFEMGDCPQPDAGAFPSCAIGEVAFAATAPGVPEPASAALLALGVSAVAVVRRRRLHRG